MMSKIDNRILGGYCSIRGGSQVAGHSGRCDTDTEEAYKTRALDAIDQARSDGQIINVLHRERDGYKALAKVRGEELVALARRIHFWWKHPTPFEDCMRQDCFEARAAITMTPEEALKRKGN